MKLTDEQKDQILLAEMILDELISQQYDSWDGSVQYVFLGGGVLQSIRHYRETYEAHGSKHFWNWYSSP